MKLRRYWFITFPENPYGPRNIGVSAYTKEEAKLLIRQLSLRDAYMAMISASLNDTTEVIEDIDTRLLDQGHVITNMGVVTFKGIWYPSLNLS
ncbi:hypothetical protein QWZ08_26310 [Ferruginibacter paludis]|uniref:hypothetical protein n=1 Tax=Ferruginibacter paludis TaxID=1310417 RepID=UPI0025B56E3E|nr:hypothetical protein [Ferruginibacter paludis]MDN3659186.1 hypothetical protein [Ferruginibacter paludis]